MRNYGGTIVAVTITLIILGCSGSSTMSTQQQDSSCRALFKIAKEENTPFSQIAYSATLKITGEDMKAIVENLLVTETSVEGTVDGIPAGENRFFALSVYDSLDTLQYYGTARTDLEAGSSVKIPITIHRVKTNAGVTIDPTISEDEKKFPTEGLVAYYPLDSDAKDYSGMDNHGTIKGAFATSDRFENDGHAMAFDGNDYIEIPYHQSLDNPQGLTVSVWAKSHKPGYEYNTDGFIVDLGYVGNNGYGLYRNHDNKSITGYYATGEMEWSGLTALDTVDTQWHHYILSYKPGDARLYRDGELQARDARPVGIFYKYPLRIGAQSKSITRFWDGAIDEVRIYNRALSLDEILLLADLKQ